MRKYMSVLGLAARATLVRVLVLTAVCAAAAAFLLCRAPFTEAAPDLVGARPWLRSLESAGSWWPVLAVYALGFGLLAALLCRTGCSFGSRTEYTLGRLRIREGAVTAVWTVYNAACLLFYWAVMAAAVYGAMVWRAGVYASGAPAAALGENAAYSAALGGLQAVLLAFYGSPFLHHLLPLRDGGVWAADLICLLACAFGAALFSHRQRQGRLSLLAAVAALAFLALFLAPLGSMWNICLPGLAMIWAGVALAGGSDELERERGEA